VKKNTIAVPLEEGLSLFSSENKAESETITQTNEEIEDEKQNNNPPKHNEEGKLAKQYRDEINSFRNMMKIHVKGTDVEDPIKSFEELLSKYGFKQYILKNIESSNYTEPTPIQMQAIPIMLKERELLACAPTGSGKTAAYLLPLLAFLKSPSKEGIRTLILSPTRELARQNIS